MTNREAIEILKTKIEHAKFMEEDARNFNRPKNLVDSLNWQEAYDIAIQALEKQEPKKLKKKSKN